MAPIKLLKYWTQRKQQGMLFFLKGTLSSLHQHRSNYHHKTSVTSLLDLEEAELIKGLKFGLLHFVAFFHVASLFSSGVNNK